MKQVTPSRKMTTDEEEWMFMLNLSIGWKFEEIPNISRRGIIEN